ncbi:MAG TPA: tyrosine-type recombinase/integrase [Bryobacteraceae bacterium]|nr:tyrosine-type recombinase/integrase [Bryobacteraceae bacterium]
MIETYFAAPHVLDRMRAGPMAPYLGPLAAELQSQDYSRKSIRRQLRNADSFGWWLTEQNLTAAEITDDLVGRYIGDLHRSARAGYSKGYRPHNARGLPRLLDLLRGSSVLPPVVAPAPRGTGPLQEFDRYLERVRGAARATRIGYLREVRGFVKHVFGDSDPHWTEIGPEHVASYITLRAAKLPITCRRDPITPMRSFLRYMTGEGLLSAHLEYAIPPIRQFKHASLPAALSPEELGKVLAVPCERTVKGLRDRAIILLLARLGLRAGEVLRLHLEDVEWRQAKLLVRAGKNHRERVLPLPEDVGEALTNYLKDGRPSADRRAMFLNLCYPHRPLGSSVTIWAIATQALRQAGVSTTRPGAHVFRHTVATHMVCGGATFKSVSDVLGHQTLGVTGIYAKLDLASLAKVALPWPGGAQ